jgi:hypothetical protein
MQRHVPNLITGSRLVLAAAFFTLLSFYQYRGTRPPSLLLTALSSFTSPRWSRTTSMVPGAQVEGEGRVRPRRRPLRRQDPRAGTFIFFAGKNFIIRSRSRTTWRTVVGEDDHRRRAVDGGGDALARAAGDEPAGAGGERRHELRRGVGGKFKMGFQSATVLIILTT